MSAETNDEEPLRGGGLAQGQRGTPHVLATPSQLP